MFRRLLSTLIALTAGLGVGCSPATPLKMHKDSGTRGPWCAPNQRVQLGQRVVGKVGWGEDRWKTYLVDDTGREHDPNVIADQVWSYLERTGDANTIMRNYHQDGRHTRMTVIALKPVVVILESRPLPPGASRSIAAPERSYWVAQVSSERSHPDYRDGLRWCSPDLKQPVTPLTFSPAGEAEIPLPNGRLHLIRSGDECRTTRE
ncbi:MAG: hypothetical protein K1X57_12990 [Gemmataceae bacterium]|nr:hypothetical protein [Gemmataceae bacterium]